MNNTEASGVSWLGIFGFFSLFYFYVSYCIVKIAENTKTDKAWQGWIPFLNLALLCRITGRGGTYAILFFLPFVNFVAVFLVFTDICELLGVPTFYGALMIFPPFNLFVLGYLSYQSPKKIRGLRP